MFSRAGQEHHGRPGFLRSPISSLAPLNDMPSNTISIPPRAHAFVCTEQGEPDVLQLREVEVVLPGPGQILMRVEWTG